MRRTTIPTTIVVGALALSGAVAGSAGAAPIGGVQLPDFRIPDQYRAGTVPNVSVIGDFTRRLMIVTTQRRRLMTPPSPIPPASASIPLVWRLYGGTVRPHRRARAVGMICTRARRDPVI